MLRLYCSKIKDVWVCIVADGEEISFSTFSTIGEKDAVAQASKALRGQKFKIQKPDSVMEKNLQALADIYYGKQVKNKFKLRTDNFPEFTRKTLLTAMKIPRGYVTTYGILSRTVGNPKAARAVGNVMAENPFTLIVPCHRVVPSDLSVGRYGLGSSEKRGILEREGVRFTEKANGKIREKFLYKFSN